MISSEIPKVTIHSVTRLRITNVNLCAKGSVGSFQENFKFV